MAVDNREPPAAQVIGAEGDRLIDFMQFEQMWIGRAVGLDQPVTKFDVAARIGTINPARAPERLAMFVARIHRLVHPVPHEAAL